MADIDRAQGAPIPTTMVTRYKDMGDHHALEVYNGGNVQTDGADVSPTNPLAEDVQVVAQSAWAVLLNDVVIDGTPAAVNSDSLDVSEYSALWIQLYVESAGAPTDVRIIPQFSHNNGANWFDFVEGYWASLYYEDTATAAPGIRHSFLLPCGGQDLVRFRAVTTGAGVGATFTVGIRARAFRGNFGVAHA